MMGREAAVGLLKKVLGRSPADQTEAVLMTEDSSLTRFAHSAVHQHVAEKNVTLILRVIVGKRIAVVTTNVLHSSSLEELLERALLLAKVQKPKEDFVSLPKPQPLPGVQTFSETVHRLTPAKKVNALRSLFRQAGEKGFQTSGAFSHGKVEVLVMNSLGVEAYQSYSDVFIHLIAEKGTATGYASFVARDADGLDMERLGNEAMEKASRGEPVQVEPGEYVTIFEPHAVAELLMFLGVLGFHALAVQEGRSFLCNQFNQKMVDPRVTIYDDGLATEGLQVPFDFEGVPKEKVTFFEAGIAKAVTYDSFTAGREGKSSTGHGLLAPNTEGPVPINLLMRGGETSLPEMVRTVRRGIYVTRFHYTNVVEPMKAVITGMTRDGTFLIEEGEVKRPVKNLRFTESILNALSRVIAISQERRICSEGTVYSRRFITGTVAPAIKVDGFNFSGVSAL
jgi:PmbA protein